MNAEVRGLREMLRQEFFHDGLAPLGAALDD
jgi:hypothetical protein